MDKTFGSRFSDFLAAPFRGADMDAMDWFLFLGLLLTFFIAWAYILNHIKEAAT
jgi:hypothetical protein